MAEHREIPVRDLPGAIRNLDVGAAVNRDKAAMLRGENPEAQTATRSAKDILTSLRAKAPHLFENGRLTVELEYGNRPKPESIEGTATEQPDP